MTSKVEQSTEVNVNPVEAANDAPGGRPSQERPPRTDRDGRKTAPPRPRRTDRPKRTPPSTCPHRKQAGTDGAGHPAVHGHPTCKIHIDDDIRGVLPRVCDQLRGTIEKSIRANGARDIIIYVWRGDGAILDGCEAYDVCQANSVEGYEVKEVECDSRDEAKLWRLRKNLSRRHLNVFERVECALAFKPGFQRLAKENQRRGGKGRQISVKADTNQAIADEAGVSKDTVRKVATILTKGERFFGKDRWTEQLAKLHAGDATVNTVYCNLKRVERPRHISNPPKAHYENIDGYEDQIICADVLEGLRRIPDGTVSLILTSPPYLGARQTYGAGFDDSMSYAKYLDWLKQLCEECARTLRAGGRLVINIDSMKNREGEDPYRFPIHADLVQMMKDPAISLIYRDEIAWVKQNITGKKMAMGSRACPAIRRNHEYVLIWHKDRKDLPEVTGQVSDLTDEELQRYTISTWDIAPASQSKTVHPHPFPEELAKRVIKLFCYPGDLVVDPFVGSGTTTYVAAMLGRRYCGIDSNSNYCNEANARIATLKTTSTKSKASSKQATADADSSNRVGAALEDALAVNAQFADEATRQNVKEDSNET